MRPIRAALILPLAAALLAASAPAQCTGDVVPNGIVNGADLGALLSYWGPRTPDPFSIAADVDGGACSSHWSPLP